MNIKLSELMALLDAAEKAAEQLTDGDSSNVGRAWRLGWELKQQASTLKASIGVDTVQIQEAA